MRDVKITQPSRLSGALELALGEYINHQTRYYDTYDGYLNSWGLVRYYLENEPNVPATAEDIEIVTSLFPYVPEDILKSMGREVEKPVIAIADGDLEKVKKILEEMNPSLQWKITNDPNFPLECISDQILGYNEANHKAFKDEKGNFLPLWKFKVLKKIKFCISIDTIHQILSKDFSSIAEAQKKQRELYDKIQRRKQDEARQMAKQLETQKNESFAGKLLEKLKENGMGKGWQIFYEKNNYSLVYSIGTDTAKVQEFYRSYAYAQIVEFFGRCHIELPVCIDEDTYREITTHYLNIGPVDAKSILEKLDPPQQNQTSTSQTPTNGFGLFENPAVHSRPKNLEKLPFPIDYLYSNKRGIFLAYASEEDAQKIFNNIPNKSKVCMLLPGDKTIQIMPSKDGVDHGVYLTSDGAVAIKFPDKSEKDRCLKLFNISDEQVDHLDNAVVVIKGIRFTEVDKPCLIM